MRFVDRTDETERMQQALSRERPSLVVLYGRRRLGKSTLVKRVLTDADIYYLADRSVRQHQLAMLAKVVAQVYPDFDKATYPDFDALLRSLSHRADRRFTLCIDEFPYLVEQSADLPSVLQKLVDERSLNFNLVLCGSSQHMMYGLFLDASAPLYGRADEIMRLAPIRLPYIQEALGLDAESAVREYAVWGGVPRYWELREGHATLEAALWHHVFSANGALREEPVKLFQDDVKDLVKTSTIMSYIGLGSNRLSEIASRCGEPATNLSRPLRKLIDLGFLEKDVPYGVDERNAKKSLYKIADPFLAFYYQFVVPHLSFIELGRRLPIEQALQAHFPAYVGMQWEKMCRDAVTGNLVGGLAYGRAKRWWGTVVNEDRRPVQVEFDVVAQSLDRRHLLVGECKWTTRENAAALTASLLRKARLLPFASDYTIVPILFLKNAPTDEADNVLLPADVLKMSL